MRDIYLTFDDAPSGNFPVLCDYLRRHDMPAVFFVRGDLCSLYPDDIVRAIQDGLVIANHSWSHHHARLLGADIATAEILKTQNLIDRLYTRAQRPSNRYMRFPHMDSGLGGWPLPPDVFDEAMRKDLKTTYARFYRNDMRAPNNQDIDRHMMIQSTLRREGFTQIPFENIHVPWFNVYAASDAVSTQGTFSHPDWLMLKRHRKDETIQSLNANFDSCMTTHPDGAHIVVMHDSPELWPVTQALLDHMRMRTVNFRAAPYQTSA